MFTYIFPQGHPERGRRNRARSAALFNNNYLPPYKFSIKRINPNQSLVTTKDRFGLFSSGGAVLTRTWAAVFDYIIDIEEDQALLLKKIYNNYYNTPISIRDEIVDLNNVLWVRAFKFIFNLWDSYKSGSIIDFMIALKLYGGAQYQNIDAKSLLMINALLNNVFQNCKNATTCKIIETYNMETKKPQYDSLKSILVGDFYDIQIFSDLDREDLKKLVNDLNWTTSYKLFNEVFAENSKYLTVHQAKGLEWRKIVVGVLPGKTIKQHFQSFLHPLRF